jgi:hypothetical protein
MTHLGYGFTQVLRLPKSESGLERRHFQPCALGTTHELPTARFRKTAAREP